MARGVWTLGGISTLGADGRDSVKGQKERQACHLAVDPAGSRGTSGVTAPVLLCVHPKPRGLKPGVELVSEEEGCTMGGMAEQSGRSWLYWSPVPELRQAFQGLS